MLGMLWRLLIVCVPDGNVGNAVAVIDCVCSRWECWECCGGYWLCVFMRVMADFDYLCRNWRRTIRFCWRPKACWRISWSHSELDLINIMSWRRKICSLKTRSTTWRWWESI